MRPICVLAASIAFAAFGHSALAADLPVKAAAPAPVIVAPPYNWTGFYVGLDGGYGWGSQDRLTTTGFANSYNSNGWLFGGHAGYNWQFNQFVLGIEGDAHWTDINGNDGGFGGTRDTTNFDFLGSIRGRAGIAFDRALVFITGGWAFATGDHTNPAGVPRTNSFSLDGWTLGAGFQWAFAPNWSAGLEYRYYDLGKYNVAPAGLFPFSVDNTLSTVTGRISYRF